MKSEKLEKEIKNLEKDIDLNSNNKEIQKDEIDRTLKEFSTLKSNIRLIEERNKRKHIGILLNKISNKIKLLINKKKTNDNSEKIFFNPYLNHLEGKVGVYHPVNLILNKIRSFFYNLGYEEVKSSEIAKIINNFDNLNFKSKHPARSPGDTFYLSNLPNYLMRTHATSFQPEEMKRKSDCDKIASISVGKVYRRDNDDKTHSHQYTNVDIMFIGKELSLSNLKWTIEKMLETIFENKIQIKIRSSFFPFTVPSFEVDIKCLFCEKNKDCSTCKNQKWIEILGAGMIHPKVLKINKIKKGLKGFALGMGVERILMIKYGIKDIRNFYINNIDFFEKFKDHE